MPKYYCKKCLRLTFSLRYIKGSDWLKPKSLPQYCEKCNQISPRIDLIAGKKQLEKIKGGD